MNNPLVDKILNTDLLDKCAKKANEEQVNQMRAHSGWVDTGWTEKYKQKFGLCDRDGDKCDCSKELAFISQVEQSAIERTKREMKEDLELRKFLLNDGTGRYAVLYDL